MYLDPVVDRTQADIDNRTAKAFLNVADWVRIYGNEEVVSILLDLLSGVDVPLHELPAPTMTTIPSVESINQLIENIELLRAYACLPDVPGLVTLRYDYRKGTNASAPDFAAVNAWENKIEVLRAAIVRAAEYDLYCGVPTTGQPRFWQARFRGNLRLVQPAASPVRRARCGVAQSGTGIKRQNGYRRY